MQSKRLYYDNSYLTAFEAKIVERTTYQNQPAVILDRSAFYPTSGGQPNDLGTLNGVQVLDVVADNGHVVHVLANELTGDSVHGLVDWQRRFDLMAQHTGQHILTRAFLTVAEADTVGFHLTDGTVTIDLDRADIPLGEIDAAEDLANQLIVKNVVVRAWFPEPSELDALDVRKISEKVTGAVRVVQIGDFDTTACGGTHVAQTGEIGLLKVVRADKKGDKLRVEFRCGQRALDDYRFKNQLLNDLASQLTTGIAEIPDMLERLREENKTLNKALRSARERLMGYEAEVLWSQAAQSASNGVVIVKAVVNDADKNDLMRLATSLSEKEQTVALLGLAGEQAHFVFACSAGIEADMVPLLKAALATVDSQRGGGRPTLAQGGGVPATTDQVQIGLNTAESLLLG